MKHIESRPFIFSPLDSKRGSPKSNLDSSSKRKKKELSEASIVRSVHEEHYMNKIFDEETIHLSVFAPQNVMRKNLNDVAWQVARQNNIFSKINLETFSLLTDIYNQQQHIVKAEDEIGKVLLSFKPRKPENARIKLILVRDNYYAGL